MNFFFFLNQVLAAVKALATFHGVWWTWLRKEAKTEEGKQMLADVNEVYSKGRKAPHRELNLDTMKVLVKATEKHGNKEAASR